MEAHWPQLEGSQLNVRKHEPQDYSDRVIAIVGGILVNKNMPAKAGHYCQITDWEIHDW